MFSIFVNHKNMGVAILMMVIGRVLTKIWPEIGIFIMAAGNLHMNGLKNSCPRE